MGLFAKRYLIRSRQLLVWAVCALVTLAIIGARPIEAQARRHRSTPTATTTPTAIPTEGISTPVPSGGILKCRTRNCRYATTTPTATPSASATPAPTATSYGYSNREHDCHADENPDAYSNCDQNRDGHNYRYGDCNRDAHANRDCNSDRDGLSEVGSDNLHWEFKQRSVRVHSFAYLQQARRRS